MPQYSAVLSGESFRRLAKQIADYREELEKRCRIFEEKVARLGYEVIQAELVTHDAGVGKTLESMEFITENDGDTYICKVRVTSDAILFLEFGSGIVGQAGSQHPLAGEMGYGPGTFPGKGHWDDPDGWFYYDSDKGGKRFHTFGQAASMPMYQGGQEMEREFKNIAKEVFQW